jgi:DNA repair exonuclease SbcCD nuclease subunit
MRAQFIHLADVHLGYDQYGSKERYNDFARAFMDILDDAIRRKVDVVLIAGDLFNKRAIDALTLTQAYESLQKLKAQSIPVVAIEGNHDRSYYRDGMSWLKFLARQKLLALLNPIMRDGEPVLAPWNPDTLLGAYFDLSDGTGRSRLRVYGLPWFGASTARVVESFARALSRARAGEAREGVEYRVLLMHTGVDGVVPHLHGLPTRAQLEPLHGLVDYLALGHVHKPYEMDGWMYNPGSTETCGAEEAQWEDRGYYHVEVDTEGIEADGQEVTGRRHLAHHLVNHRRPFWRFTFRVDGLSEPARLAERFEEFCRRQAVEMNSNSQLPVVEMILNGVLGFDAGSLDRPRLEEIMRAHFHPLIARLHNLTRDVDFDPDDEGLDGRDRSTRSQLEQKIFRELLARDDRYRLRAEEWAKLLAELKQLALDGEEPTNIAARLREARARLLA